MEISKITVATATLPLETELFAWASDDRDSRILARHYGLDGKGGANFQRIGDEFGLTRERVRQIVSETDPSRYFKPGALSALTRIVATIASSLPAPAADLESRLQTEGLVLNPFRLEGIIQIGSLLGCPVPFRLTRQGGRRYAVAAGFPPFQKIVSRARQKVRRCGMATLSECIGGRGKTGSAQRELDLAEVVLSAQRDFRWLLPGSGWFWFADTAPNRVASRIRKMLAVANPLTIDEIREGLARMRDPLAPNSILLELCRQLPGLSVDGEIIRADAEIKIDEVLNKTEIDIFQLLSEHNGCMSNSELICRSRVLGMKRPTFYQCVTYSPIVSRYNRSHYRLIGSRLQDEDNRTLVSLAQRAPAQTSRGAGNSF